MVIRFFRHCYLRKPLNKNNSKKLYKNFNGFSKFFLMSYKSLYFIKFAQHVLHHRIFKSRENSWKIYECGFIAASMHPWPISMAIIKDKINIFFYEIVKEPFFHYNWQSTSDFAPLLKHYVPKNWCPAKHILYWYKYLYYIIKSVCYST